MKLEFVNKFMAKMVFWNPISDRPGSVMMGRPIKCAGCKKEIKNNDCYKKERSFDLYHTKCYEKYAKSEITFIGFDEAEEISEETYLSLKPKAGSSEGGK